MYYLGWLYFASVVEDYLLNFYAHIFGISPVLSWDPLICGIRNFKFFSFNLIKLEILEKLRGILIFAIRPSFVIQ